MSDCLPGHQPGTGEVGAKDSIPVRFGIVQVGVFPIFFRPIDEDPGIVHQDINTAKVRHDLPHRSHHVRFAAHIAAIGTDALSCFPGDAACLRLCFRQVIIHQSYVAPLSGQGLHIFVAQAGGSAGNHRHLACQIKGMHGHICMVQPPSTTMFWPLI